jgi:endonuclease/exonuclease/phosphatase family metal-dependent hydrolase
LAFSARLRAPQHGSQSATQPGRPRRKKPPGERAEKSGNVTFRQQLLQALVTARQTTDYRDPANAQESTMNVSFLRRSVVRLVSACASLTLLASVAACGQPEEETSQAAMLRQGEWGPEFWLGTTQRLRLMGANISSGNKQSYDPGEGARIFQGLKPDVVMIQEFNYRSNSSSDIRGFVDSTFGSSFAYYREGGAQIPNGVISRYPIVESGEWDDSQVSNRDYAWARIDLPGPVDLWAVSVHFLTSSSSKRKAEASELAGYIAAKVPAGDYVVIGGDFNTDNRSEAALGSLAGTVVTAGPYPADSDGNGNTNASRRKPYDWVLVDSDLDAHKTATVVGGSSFPSGLVVDTRRYSPISEIAPASTGDSGATNMQHMAVVRDFLIPTDAPILR